MSRICPCMKIFFLFAFVFLSLISLSVASSSLELAFMLPYDCTNYGFGSERQLLAKMAFAMSRCMFSGCAAKEKINESSDCVLVALSQYATCPAGMVNNQ